MNCRNEQFFSNTDKITLIIYNKNRKLKYFPHTTIIYYSKEERKY